AEAVEEAAPAPEPEVEEVAAEVLIPAEEAQRLIAAGEWAAVVGLGEDAVVPLIHALIDADWTVRRKAAGALTEIGDPAVEELRKVLESPDEGVRALAAEVLSKLGLEVGDEAEKARRLIDARQWDQVAKIGFPAVSALAHTLRTEDAEVRKQAAAVLGVMGDERALEPLAGALEDDDTDVRRKVVWALGRIGGKDVVEPLLGALRDDDSDVRAKSASILEHLGWKPVGDSDKVAYLIARKEWDKLTELGDEAVGPLTARLEDEDARVREDASWILEEIKSAQEMESLFKSLKKE
ncbi:MAG: HEAT repeat domain-containing protein, partial [Actinobacteria bacterium]|nr:HEAT repeat domain-containing protein [Actinomycetota bacterium]